MSFVSRVRAALLGAWPNAMPLPWLGQRIEAGGASLPAPTAVGAQHALALPVVHRCCSLLADACSTAPPTIFRRQQKGGRLAEVDSAAARALATMSHADAEMFAFSTALVGNGYLRILRDGTGAPFELQAIPPWRVQLEIEATTRRVFYRIAADSTIEEPAALLSERDVVHARYRLTGPNRLMGVPPIAACSPAFALALQSRDVVRVLFSNLASPSGVLHTEGKMQPEVAKALQTQWENAFRNGGLGRVAVLTNGLEYSPIAWSAVDAQLLEQVKASTDDIAACFGIPPQFVNGGGGQSLTYASAVEGTRGLYVHALRGFCARLADALAQRLLSRNERAAGATLEYDLSNVLVLPGSELADYLSKLANAGLASPNEIRNGWLGLGDVPGGDVLRAPVNTAPIDRWAKGDVKAEPAPAGEPA